MEHTAPHSTTRLLAAIALLVLVGWGWALSNVGMPDAAWLVNAGLTVVLVVLLVVAGVRRFARG
jgi:hypothetical protein